MITVLTVCVFVLVAFALIRSSPRWWRTIISEDPATIAMAVNVENRVVNSINDHKPKAPTAAGQPWRSDPWTIPIHAVEANAWLNVRLPKWVANQQDPAFDPEKSDPERRAEAPEHAFRWPRNLSDLQVDFTSKQITIGARVRSGDRHQVLTATLGPRLEAAGALWVPAQWVNLGRLSIPASWILERAKSGTADYVPTDLRNLEQTQKLFRAFEGLEPIYESAAIQIGGQRLRILQIVPKDGVLEVTCQTERDE